MIDIDDWLNSYSSPVIIAHLLTISFWCISKNGNDATHELYL